MKWTFLVALVLANFLSIPSEAQRRAPPPDDELEAARQFYRDLDNLEAWCDDVIRYIERAKDKGFRDYRRGEYEGAIQEYVSGMQRALDRGKYVTGVMTKRALRRGIDNIAALKRAIGGTSEKPNVKGLKTTAWYASHYSDFVINVAEDLDKVHMARRTRCRDCHYEGEEEFEQKFVWFIGETVDVGLEALKFEANGENFPIGYGRALLMTMKAAAKVAAGDLNESAWSSYYSCTIQDLEDMAADIDPDDPNDREELEDYWYPLKDISNELLENRGRCENHGRHWSGDGRPRRGPGGPGVPR